MYMHILNFNPYAYPVASIQYGKHSTLYTLHISLTKPSGFSTMLMFIQLEPSNYTWVMGSVRVQCTYIVNIWKNRK